MKEEEEKDRRPEESPRQTSRQASRQASKAGKKSARVAGVSYRGYGGGGGRVQPACSCLFYHPLPLVSLAQIPRTPLEFHTSYHRRSRYPLPL